MHGFNPKNEEGKTTVLFAPARSPWLCSPPQPSLPSRSCACRRQLAVFRCWREDRTRQNRKGATGTSDCAPRFCSQHQNNKIFRNLEELPTPNCKNFSSFGAAAYSFDTLPKNTLDFCTAAAQLACSSRFGQLFQPVAAISKTHHCNLSKHSELDAIFQLSFKWKASRRRSSYCSL